MSSNSGSFRKDIEGLRAVAVLLVITSHYDIPGMSAGFIGVDIFFVISGFLITGILTQEYEKSGNIELSRFYANRLRRLLPALIAMLATIAVAAYWMLPIGQQISTSLGGATATLWISNIYFAFSDIDYFATPSSSNILLHTWSLGVEEQFYLFWSLLILAVSRRAKNLHTSLISTCMALASFSFFLCLALGFWSPMQAYYLMPTRAWQFAAGGLTWYFVQKFTPSSKQATLANWSGSAVLLCALIVIRPHVAYPSILALLPTSATCIMLWAGSGSRNNAVQHVLSHGIMQRIGSLSYPLYLWHWPIWVLIKYHLPDSSFQKNIILAFTCTVLLAYITYFFIETPIRFGKISKSRSFWQIGLAVAVSLLISNQMLRWNENSVYLMAQEKATRNISDGKTEYISRIYSDGCDDWYRSDKLNPCIYGNSNAVNTIVLFGDSIGAQWFPTLSAIYKDDSWRIVVLTKSSCPIVDESYFYTRIGREYTECSSWRKKAINWLQQNKTTAIFIGSTASSNFDDQQWEQGSLRILNTLAPNTDAIYLIESNPILPFNAFECLAQKDPSTCQSISSNPGFEKVATALKRAIAQQPKASWIETASFVCPNDSCQARRKIGNSEIDVYRDNQHLTASFAAAMHRNFEAQIHP